MIIPEWPANLYRERGADWAARGNTVLPPRAWSTLQVPVGMGDPMLWTAQMSDIQIGDVLQHRAFAAMRAQVGAGTAPVVVRCLDPRLVPWPAGITASPSGIPFSDGTLHSDGTGHGQSAMSVHLADDVAKGQTEFRLSIARCGPLVGGEVFSILHPAAHWRMYSIGWLSGSGSLVTVRIPGGLWEAAASGTELIFDRPCCTMTVSAEDGGITSSLSAGRRLRTAGVHFVEAHPRLVSAYRSA